MKTNISISICEEKLKMIKIAHQEEVIRRLMTNAEGTLSLSKYIEINMIDPYLNKTPAINASPINKDNGTKPDNAIKSSSHPLADIEF